MDGDIRPIESIENMTQKEAEAHWYSMWGSCMSGQLSSDWWVDGLFGRYMMTLAEKVGKPYDARTMKFKED